jgi:hypothetical protein
MNLPLFFIATYSKRPMWGACVRSLDGIRYAQIDGRASLEVLRQIEFDLVMLTEKGNIREPYRDDWRKATPQEIPLVMANLGYRLIFKNADLGWVKAND